MKISKETLSILKSFTTINPSIYVNPGHQLRTISTQKTVVAVAEVKDEFETPFGIYDLNQFLSAISIFDNPEFEFSDKFVEVSGAGASIKYGFADGNMIMQPPAKNLELPDTIVSFDLPESILKKTMQAANVLSLPNWTVKGENDEIAIVVADSKNSSSNAFRHVVGETDQEFELVFKVENIKPIMADYRVSISSKGISEFSADNGRLLYYIATESR